MMSLRNWLCLMVIYVLYLLLGGYSFNALENPTDCDKMQNQRVLEEAIKQRIYELRVRLPPVDQDNLQFILEGIDLHFLGETIFSGQDFFPLAAHDNSNVTDPVEPAECVNWNLYNSIFFSFTAVTTIGYGHMSPITEAGKLLCVFYSLLGVPINGILIGSLGTYFGSKLKSLTKNASRAQTETTKVLLLLLDAVIYLIPGVVIFVLAPAGVFCLIEDWAYLDSFYFAFVTLTTIGFGDYVAGRDSVVLDRLGDWKIVYETGLIIWIILGMGYIFMIITVIGDALRKPARRAAKRFRAAEKVMLAKIVQEILIMKTSKQNNEPRYSMPIVVCDELDDNDSVHMTQNMSQLKPSSLAREHYDNFGMLYDDIHINAIRANGGDIERHHEEDTDSDPGGGSPPAGDYLDHDTITSLHQFMRTSKHNAHRDMFLENNVPPGARFQRSVSVHSEDSMNAATVGRYQKRLSGQRSNSMDQKDLGSSQVNADRDSLLLDEDEREARLRRVSVVSSPAGRIHSSETNIAGTYGGMAYQHMPPEAVSLQDILRNTTLEEFLRAADKVKQDYLLENQRDANDPGEVAKDNHKPHNSRGSLSSVLRMRQNHSAPSMHSELPRSLSFSVNAHLVAKLNRLFGDHKSKLNVSGGAHSSSEDDATSDSDDGPTVIVVPRDLANRASSTVRRTDSKAPSRVPSVHNELADRGSSTVHQVDLEVPSRQSSVHRTDLEMPRRVSSVHRIDSEVPSRRSSVHRTDSGMPGRAASVHNELSGRGSMAHRTTDPEHLARIQTMRRTDSGTVRRDSVTEDYKTHF